MKVNGKVRAILRNHRSKCFCKQAQTTLIRRGGDGLQAYPRQHFKYNIHSGTPISLSVFKLQ